MKNILILVPILFALSCVENLNLGSCGGDCPLNQTCIDFQCGCEKGTEKLGIRCYTTIDGYYIGDLGNCIGRLGLTLPENGSMKYKFDSSKEGVYQGVEKEGETYIARSFSTCTINNSKVESNLYLRIQDDGRMAVKLIWKTDDPNNGDTVIDEVNTFFALPEKHQSPITPR